MITTFGKVLRSIRLQKDLLLKNMADGIGLSSSHLSGIETGRKPIPQDLVEKVSEFLGYKKESKEYLDLKEAEAFTNKEIVIDISDVDENKMDAAMVFARKFKEVDQDKLNKLISELLDNKK